jgi:hypothetical protein
LAVNTARHDGRSIDASSLQDLLLPALIRKLQMCVDILADSERYRPRPPPPSAVKTAERTRVQLMVQRAAASCLSVWCAGAIAAARFG